MKEQSDQQLAELAIGALYVMPVPPQTFYFQNVPQHRWVHGFLNVMRLHPSPCTRVWAAAVILHFCHEDKRAQAALRASMPCQQLQQTAMQLLLAHSLTHSLRFFFGFHLVIKVPF